MLTPPPTTDACSSKDQHIMTMCTTATSTTTIIRKAASYSGTKQYLLNDASTTTAPTKNQRSRRSILADFRKISLATFMLPLVPSCSFAADINTEANIDAGMNVTIDSSSMGPTNLNLNTEAAPIKRPWAPMEALLPASRFRILLHRAIDLVEQLPLASPSTISTTSQSTASIVLSNQGTIKILSELETIMAPPPPGKIAEMKPTKSIRIAFNTYTTYLRYGDRYTLTASPLERKNMIRQDRLPNVKQVITADLDLRDLYRNQVLTNVDEARAELRYLIDRYNHQYDNVNNHNNVKDNDNKLQYVDGESQSELLMLLKNAAVACDEWFGLIPEEDVAAALDAVVKIEESVSVSSASSGTVN